MFVLKAISTILSKRASHTRNRKVSFASTLSTSHTYELSIEERRGGTKVLLEAFNSISKNNRPARQQEGAHFQIHGHWPEDDVKAKM